MGSLGVSPSSIRVARSESFTCTLFGPSVCASFRFLQFLSGPFHLGLFSCLGRFCSGSCGAFSWRYFSGIIRGDFFGRNNYGAISVLLYLVGGRILVVLVHEGRILRAP